MATNHTAPVELHKQIASPQIAAPVVVLAVPLNITETTTTTFNLLRAARKYRLVSATYVQAAAATAVTSLTMQLKNGSTGLSSALDIKALGANGSAAFAGIPRDGTEKLASGDVLTVVMTPAGGTVTAPARVVILLELQLLA